MKYLQDESTNDLLCEPECAEEWLGLMYMMGADYNKSENDPEVLKNIIDEFINYSYRALNCLYKGKITIKDINSK